MRTLILSFFLSTVGFAGTVNLTLASDPANWSTLTAQMNLPPGWGNSDSLNYHQSIITTGPIRTGFLQIQTGGYNGYAPFGSSSLDLGFTGGPVNGVVIEASCGFQGCLPGNGYYGYYNRIPVTLGTSMELEAVGSIGYTGSAPDPLAYYIGGSQDGSFQFRFLEADGTTPVDPDVSAAPEPSTWGMLLVAGVLGILGVRRYRVQ